MDSLKQIKTFFSNPKAELFTKGMCFSTFTVKEGAYPLKNPEGSTPCVVVSSQQDKNQIELTFFVSPIRGDLSGSFFQDLRGKKTKGSLMVEQFTSSCLVIQRHLDPAERHADYNPKESEIKALLNI